MNKKTKKGDYLDILLRSKATVFSTKDIALLWGEKNSSAARVRLNYYVRKGKLFRIHRGLYIKDKNYNKFELSGKIYNPSYISFETVLAKCGVIFQFYSQIFAASYLKREMTVDNQKYYYNRIKDSVLTDQNGVELKDNYYIASPERAFLDVVYLNRKYYFDNLLSLNWEKIFEILPIYENKNMEKKIEKHYKSTKK